MKCRFRRILLYPVPFLKPVCQFCPAQRHWHMKKGSRIGRKERWDRVGYLRDEERWEKFALFIQCKCCLFVRKDLELMKKSQGGQQNGRIIQQGYMVIITKTNPSIQKRTEERRQEETFKTQRSNNMWLSESSRQHGLQPLVWILFSLQ